MHLEHLVDLLHLPPAARRDALLALGVEQRGVRAFLAGHRADDRIHMDQDLVVHPARRHRRLGLLHARHHPGEHPQPAHVLHLAQLHPQIVEIELALGHLARERLGVFLIDRRGGLLDQADDIAHAQDAARNAFRIEGLDRVELLAGARELDRLAGDKAHRQRRAAARIAIHPGEHHAGQRHLVGEALGDIDRVLPGQAIDHQQHFGGSGDAGDRLHLGHQRFVDMQPARGVEQQHIGGLQLRAFHRAARDIDRLLAFDDRQRGDRDLLAEHRELFLRRRTVDVERGHQRLLAVLLLEQLGDLGGGGGLARALQADHHDHHRWLGIEVERSGFVAAEHLDQFVIDDLDDLLAGGDRAQHILADRLFGDRIDEATHHRQRGIGLEQRDPHLAHRVANILFGQRATALELVEDGAEPI